MAFRHHCPNAGRSGSLKCPGGDGRPGKGPKRCPGCHGQLVIEEGRYGIFAWRGDGHYDTHGWVPGERTWQNEAAAGRRADALNDDADRRKLHPRGYVVRFIPDTKGA